MAGIMRRNEQTALIRPEPFSYQYSYDSTNNIRYQGWANPGADTDADVWLISKKIYRGKRLIAVQWAGTAEFNQVWNNRTSLTYTGDGATGSYPSVLGDGETDVAAAGSSSILGEDGGAILGEDGGAILEESSSTAGQATQLSTTKTFCTYVIITAKSDNTDPIWIGGSTVDEGRGIKLLTTSNPIRIVIDDLRKIYINGTAGDGVTYTYCGAEDDTSLDALTNTDGIGLTNTDGEDLENT